MTEFDEGIAVAPLGDGAYAADVAPGWSAPPGPNGGYLAAIVLRAMEALLSDPARPARSITLHYLRAPKPGPVRIDVVVERAGRTLSTLTARLSQGDRLCLIAIGAFSAAFPNPAAEFSAPMPQVAPAETIAPAVPKPDAPAIAHRLVVRHAIGSRPFSESDEALTGGWMSLHEPQTLDAAALALYADAFLPAVFTLFPRPVPVPTIDLTIHFRNPAAALAAGPERPVLGVFRSDCVADGLLEEDGELWSADGVLLAQSRQLALIRPLEDA